MVPKKIGKASRRETAPISSGLSSALLLKEKLLAGQQGASKKKVSKQARAKTQATGKLATRKSRRPKTQDEEEYRNREETEADKDQEESGDDDRQQESAMYIMRKQFEKQFGKIKGIESPVIKSKEPEKKAPKKSKKDTTRKNAVKEQDEDSDDHELPKTKKKTNGNAVKSFLHGFDDGFADSDSDDYSDFEVDDKDFEEQEEDGPVVIKFDDSHSAYSGSTSQTMSTTRREKRLFMSSKAPASIETRETPATNNRNGSGNVDDEDEEDKILTQQDMKNDLELQRLLRESHILLEAREQGHLSGYDIANAYVSDEKNGLSQYSNETHHHKGKGALFGDVRLKAMEMRMDSIGMKRKQAKPLNMKVLQQNAKERKQNRRLQIDEARESGVVLATSVLRKEEKIRKRNTNKGLQFKQVGKQTKTGLVLSKQDIAKITSKD